MRKLVEAYYKEATWFSNGYVPPVDEYMENALVSSTYMILATTSQIGMGELVTKETLDWVSNEPLIVRAASIISRLMSDMVGHEVNKFILFMIMALSRIVKYLLALIFLATEVKIFSNF